MMVAVLVEGAVIVKIDMGMGISVNTAAAEPCYLSK